MTDHEGGFNNVFLCMLYGKNGDLLTEGTYRNLQKRLEYFNVSTFCELEGCSLMHSMWIRSLIWFCILKVRDSIKFKWKR